MSDLTPGAEEATDPVDVEELEKLKASNQERKSRLFKMGMQIDDSGSWLVDMLEALCEALLTEEQFNAAKWKRALGLEKDLAVAEIGAREAAIRAGTIPPQGLQGIPPRR